METPGYNVVPFHTGDRDYVHMEKGNSTQHEDDSVVLTGVQDHDVEAIHHSPC